jgi:hypothetical protein
MDPLKCPIPSAQLADFLEAPLRRSNGIITLPEAFCLFNRARGAELVSPDDILKVWAGVWLLPHSPTRFFY